jgi:hypothetical protein
MARGYQTNRRRVCEKRTVAIPFDTASCTVPAFDVLPDGRPVIARTVVQDHKGKTIITVLDASGHVADESQVSDGWRYGYLKGTDLHGFAGPNGAYVKETVAKLQ